MKIDFLKKIHRKWKIWIIPLVVIICIPAIYLLTRPSHDNLFREPNPNGYDDFLQAIEVGFFDNRVFESDESTMRTVVEENQESIHHVLIGLEKDCQVKFEPDQKKHVGALSGFSSLVWVLIRRAQIMELEGRVDESVRAYMEVYRFAHESSRGGNFNDRLSCTGKKIKVMREIQHLILKINPVQANSFLRLIDNVEMDKENLLKNVMLRDECWNDTAYGYSWRIDRVKFYANRVIQQRSLSSLSILFSDLDGFQKKYISDYLEPVKVMLRKQAAGMPTPR